MDLHKIKQVTHFKDQCKKFGVTYTDVAKDCDFNVDSFQTAMQSGSISRKRIEKAFKSLKKLVYQKGLRYTIEKKGLDPNETASNIKSTAATN